MPIPAGKIKDWKQYTLKYFRDSPNAFLIENTFYNTLSANMKTKVVKDLYHL